MEARDFQIIYILHQKYILNSIFAVLSSTLHFLENFNFESQFILHIRVAKLNATRVAKEESKYQKHSLRQNQEGDSFLHFKKLGNFQGPGNPNIPHTFLQMNQALILFYKCMQWIYVQTSASSLPLLHSLQVLPTGSSSLAFIIFYSTSIGGSQYGRQTDLMRNFECLSPTPTNSDVIGLRWSLGFTFLKYPPGDFSKYPGLRITNVYYPLYTRLFIPNLPSSRYPVPHLTSATHTHGYTIKFTNIFSPL